MISTAKRIGQVETYYFAKKLAEIRMLNDKGCDIINLGIGSPDLPPPAEVVDALVNALSDSNAHQYQPYKGIPELTQAFAAWYKNHFEVEINAAEEILPLIGSKEGVMHISMTFLNEGDEVLVPNPGYPSYSMNAQIAGATVRYFDLEEKMNWLPDLKKLDKEDVSKVKLMWINYPNMPTGGNATLAFYEELIAFAKKHHILVCHDNPYTFILNDNPVNIFSAPGSKEVVLELTSLSKNYNMAGWRIGAVTGDKKYIDELLKFKSNMDSGMFKPIQKAASIALAMQKPWFDHINSIYRLRKTIATQILLASGCSIAEEGAGMFVWAKISDSYDNAEQLSEILLHKANVFITPGHIFGEKGHRYLRISLCSNETQLNEALKRIKELNKIL